MKSIILILLIFAGCSEHSARAVPLDASPEVDPETGGLSWSVIDRMEEHFGDRVSIEDLGEFDDGEHYQVIHSGIPYLVVYDVELDKIKSVSKAGTQGEDR
ncbi:hypothetical protein [Gimesia algae]|uniref:PepSY domain-containing protein n=1 Tax=Gimesia algae TaxID=2527971 RepID=A0A517VMK8_9PLAN|nr:hypothetical protein [Gimesia algae]QDT94252.1 hypothetical protein Pan161_59470 [Gimesia algae]